MGKKKCNRPFAECENGLFNLLEREEKTTTTKNKEFKSLNFVNFILKFNFLRPLENRNHQKKTPLKMSKK